MGKPTTDPLYTIVPTFRTRDETLGLCKGPLHVICFCCLSIVFPALLISVPLLMRFVICGSSTYVMNAADMMILDHKISTIWCKSEWVTMNATFTAYVTEGEPQLIKSPDTLIMTKTLIIPDDHKEYWGFYLLKGSKFSLSACPKFKGATVLVVQGRSHLHHCAYIGNADSNGNSDEHSDSNSVETRRFSLQPVRRILNSTVSAEELSQIMKQIRTYIKTHPRGYNHMQKNLFGLFQTNNNTVRKKRTIQDSQVSGIIYQRHVNPKFPLNADGAFEEDLDYKSPDSEDETKKKTNGSHTNRIWDSHRHSGVLNFTTNFDGSNSESESSFSSSEEALAKCEGIVGIFNLNHSDICGKGHYTLEYNGTIADSGFYYFIFGSENEKTSNVLNINVALERYEYDLRTPLENCTNVRKCEFNFDFASNQKLVVSIPTAQEETWDGIYIVETDCIPRTSIYLIFILMVPLMILVCAFQ